MRYVRFNMPKKNRVCYGICQPKAEQPLADNIGTINCLEGDTPETFKETGKILRMEDINKFLAPVLPPNIIAIGLNYKDHAIESKMQIPDAPVIFIKSTNSVIGPKDHIVLPEIAPNEVDYEAELVIVIGKKAKNISPGETYKYVWGYTCGNDVSARDCQLKLDKQWARGKSFDTFCPIGPWIETDFNPTNARISLKLNGELMQSSNTSEFIFPVDRLVSYLSKCMTLYPGTIIMTGTPSGVGFTRKPPVFLKPGDTVEVEIEGIGKLINPVKK